MCNSWRSNRNLRSVDAIRWKPKSIARLSDVSSSRTCGTEVLRQGYSRGYLFAVESLESPDSGKPDGYLSGFQGPLSCDREGSSTLPGPWTGIHTTGEERRGEERRGEVWNMASSMPAHPPT